MKVYTKRSKLLALEGCVIEIDSTREWTYLELGIEELIKSQKEIVQIYRDEIADPTVEDYDYYVISKDLKEAEEKLKHLKTILYALNSRNTFELSELDIDEIRQKKLWSK